MRKGNSAFQSVSSLVDRRILASENRMQDNLVRIFTSKTKRSMASSTNALGEAQQVFGQGFAKDFSRRV